MVQPAPLHQIFQSPDLKPLADFLNLVGARLSGEQFPLSGEIDQVNSVLVHFPILLGDYASVNALHRIDPVGSVSALQKQ